MDNFFTRIITSIFLILILLFSLLYNKYLWLTLLILVSIISFLEFNNLIKKIWKKKNKFYLINLSVLFYLFLFTYSAYLLGMWSWQIALYILSISIMSDVGGYIIGNVFGGKKLTKISPNKTISGAIGSFVFSLIPLILIFNIYDIKNLFYLTAFTLFLSLISQLGDLFISYFKRKSKVKDTGNILPGHGGLLDRVDGVIFVVPLSFFIILISGNFN